MALNCRIEKDGSLTVSSGTAYLIRNMYPGIDGHSLHAIRIIKEENKVVWETVHGNAACMKRKRKALNWNFPWIIIQARFIPYISFIRLISGPKAFTRRRKGWEEIPAIMGKTACLKGERS